METVPIYKDRRKFCFDDLLDISPPKQDSGFHLDRLPVPPIRLELPFAQSISDHLRLIGECAEKMNVLDLACSVDDDSDRNRVKLLLATTRHERIKNRNPVSIPQKAIYEIGTDKASASLNENCFIHISVPPLDTDILPEAFPGTYPSSALAALCSH